MATLDELLAQADTELGSAVVPVTPPVQTPVSAAPSSFGDIAASYASGIKQGIYDLPSNLYDFASSIAKYATPGASLTPQSLMEQKIAQEQSGLSPLGFGLQQGTQAVEAVGRGASQVAGGIGGGVIGGLPGAAIGAGLGDVAFTSLADLLSGKPQTTLAEKAYQAGYGTGGAVAGEGIAKVLPKGIVAAQEAKANIGNRLQEALGPQTAEAALAELGKQEIIQKAYPEAILAERLKEIKKEPIGVQTSAELYPTGPGAMIEKAIAGQAEFQLPYSELRQAAGETGVTKLLEELRPSERLIENPESLGAYDLGEVKKQVLTKADEALQQKLDDLYAPIDNKYTVTKWGPAKSNITKAIENYGGGEQYITGDFRTLVDDIRGSKEFKVGRLQLLRSKALRFQREFRDAGDRGLAAVAGTVGEQLKNMIEKTPTGAKDWKAANAAAAPLLKLRNEGPLGGVLLDRNLTNEKLLNKVVTNKSSVKQYKDLIQDDPVGIAALQTHFINELTGKTPSQRAAYIAQRKGALQEAFGNNYETLDAMKAQQARYAELARLSTPLRGSQTAPLAELSPKIGELVAGKVPESSAQSMVSNVGKKIVGALIGHSIMPGFGDLIGYEIASKLESPFNRSTRLQKQALYDIATNPYKAIEAQRLAKALSGQQVAAATSPVTTAQLQDIAKGVQASGALSLPLSELPQLSGTDQEQMLLSNIEQLFGNDVPSVEALMEAQKQDISASMEEQPSLQKTVLTNKSFAKKQVEEALNNAANKHGVDVNELKAIAKVESSFNPSAVGPKTKYGQAEGLMQLMPATAKALGIKDAFDPKQSADGAGKLLTELESSFGKYNDRRFIWAAYNSRPQVIKNAIAKVKADDEPVTWSNVSRYVPSETKQYVKKISQLV